MFPHGVKQSSSSSWSFQASPFVAVTKGGIPPTIDSSGPKCWCSVERCLLNTYLGTRVPKAEAWGQPKILRVLTYSFCLPQESKSGTPAGFKSSSPLNPKAITWYTNEPNLPRPLSWGRRPGSGGSGRAEPDGSRLASQRSTPGCPCAHAPPSQPRDSLHVSTAAPFQLLSPCVVPATSAPSSAPSVHRCKSYPSRTI